MASSGVQHKIETAVHIVVTVHGIRTFGKWQERLEHLVQADRPDIRFIHYKYGYFSLLGFIFFPLQFLVARRFTRELREILRKHADARVDLVGHSFGTYLIARSLFGLHDKSVHTVILAASTLKSNYPWSIHFTEGRIKSLVNECGNRDWILFLNQLFIPLSGMAGRLGFIGMVESSRFVNNWYNFGHSGYFQVKGEPSDEFMRSRWVPLLVGGDKVDHSDVRVSGISGGVLHFLLNNIEPLKLTLFISPLVVAIVILANLYVTARRDEQAISANALSANAALLYQTTPEAPHLSSVLAIHSLRHSFSYQAIQVLFDQLRFLPETRQTGRGYAVLSPDGKRIIVREFDSNSHSLAVLDASNGAQIARRDRESFLTVQFSEDSRLLFGYNGTSVWVLRTSDLALLSRFPCNDCAYSFTSDGSRLAVSGSPTEGHGDLRSVTIWDTLRGKKIAKSHLADQITGLLIDPTESLLAVSARHFRPGLNPDLQERQIYFELRTIPSGTIVYRSSRKKRSLAAWSFSGDGKMFAAADSGGDVVIMNVRAVKQNEPLRPYWILHLESQVSDIDFSKDGRLIAIGAKDGAVRVFDVRARRAIMSVTADEAVSKIRFVRSGQFIASLSTDELEMWKVGSDVEVLRAGTGEGSEFISISADGMKAVLSSEESWTLFQKTTSTTPFQTEKAGSSALLSPGGKYLAVRTPCCLEVLRQADHKLILRIEEPDQEPDPTDSPEIWDNETGMLFPRFSTDENFLAETPEDIWDLRTGKRSSEKGPIHGGAIWADTAEETLNEMKISNKCFPNNECYPDSDLVVATSRQRVTLTGLSALHDFAISHNGEFAALLTIDRIVQVFSIKTGKELFRVRTDDTSALAFTDDDRALILSTSDGTVYEGYWRTNDIVAETCRRLGRGLTIEEWSRYANGKYEPGCLPLK